MGLASYNAYVPSSYYRCTRFNPILDRLSSIAYGVGFVSSRPASTIMPKFTFLLGTDELSPASIPPDAFVVYQGHRGDLVSSLVDVCFPGAAYTEKSITWINTEGRSQLGRAAVLLGLLVRIGRPFSLRYPPNIKLRALTGGIQ
jgi:hypothetical protein